MTKYVAYYRVSTTKQGFDGLGMDAQRASVQSFANGSDIVAEYVEVESGRKNDRPELLKALAFAKANKAVLLIAKIDRLARNVHFVSGLLESGVEIKCADMPEANRMMLQMLSVFAEHEARMISERTKAALAMAKERGQALGGIRHGSMETNRQRGQASAERAMTLIQSIPDYQNLSFNALAIALNRAGHKTTRGNTWTAMQVSRTLSRTQA
ncbi:recombinase family protein [Agrobacterium sp. 16-2014-1-2a]